MTPEKDLIEHHSAVDDLLADLKELIPGAFADGNLEIGRLRELVGDSDGSDPEASFGLSWPGRDSALGLLKMPVRGSLRPDGDSSLQAVDHVFIKGENLEVMQLLQKAYFGSFKVIYLDPPYNNGYDVVYVDDLSDPLGAYLAYVEAWSRGDRKPAGVPSTGSRVHSRWLSMMFPRLLLARNLLAEDGVLFAAIDDHESHHLRMLMDEIFGPENFVCTFIWEKRYAPAPDARDAGYVHENILCYRRSDSFEGSLLPMTEAQKGRYRNPDSDPRGPWKPADYTCRFTAQDRPTLYYPIRNPNSGEKIWPKKSRVWACSSEEHAKNEAEGRVWWGADGANSVPAKKKYLSEIAQGAKPMTLLKHEVVGHTDEATKELRAWFPDLGITPKPTRLIRHLLSVAGVQSGDLVLDPFARVGTLAEAVINANVEADLGAKFVLIQFPEPAADDSSEPLSWFAMERARRRLERLEPGDPPQTMRSFSLDSSSFVAPSPMPPASVEEIEEQLRLLVNNVKEERTEIDLMFEILLAHGYPLDIEITELQEDGHLAYTIDDSNLVLFLGREITPGIVEWLGRLAKARVVCLDAAFGGDDALRTNGALQLRERGIELATI